MLHPRSLAARLLCGAALVVTLGGASCSPAGPAASADGAAAACTSETLAACEQALLTASAEEMPARIAAYARARDEPGYEALWTALAEAPAEPLALSADGAALSSRRGGPVAGATWPGPPQHVAAEALVAALGRAAGRRHLFLKTDAGLRQIFPQDALATRMAGAVPAIAADPAKVADDLALAAALRSTLEQAAAFDYVAAAKEAEALGRLAEGRDRDDEAAMRAWLAVSLLDGAGIGLLEPPGDDDEADEDPPAEPPPYGPKSSPYALLVALHLAGEGRDALFAKTRAQLAEGVDAERMRAFDALWGGDATCPVPFVPPMRDAGDMVFASPFVAALDADVEPGAKPGEGQLGLDEWLPAYDRLVTLVQEQSQAWHMVSTLLEQRGAVGGLSGEGTTSYRKVTTMASRHVDALGTLAQAQPARFQTLGAVNLAYLPGVLTDRALREAVTKLAQKSVALKVDSAEDVSQLWEAAIAAFAIGMGYPPALQGPHFAALRQGLGQKLASSFGTKGGWGIAGLLAGNAALGALLGDPEALRAAAPPVARALAADPAISYPGIARLVTSAVRYAELAGSGALDPDVSNRNMFPEARKKAREALGAAIRGLTTEGPASPPERAYATLLTAYADGIIVALLSEATAEGGEQVHCAGTSGVRKELRDAFDRLAKKRKELLAHRATSSRDASPWLRRARLLGLLLSDGLDVADQKQGRLKFKVDDDEARRRVEQALEGWTNASGAVVASSLYLLARGALGEGEVDAKAMLADAVKAFEGLADLFGADGGGSSLFTKLATIGAGADLEAGTPLASVLTKTARRAYAAGETDHGDLLLMLSLGVALSRSEPVVDEAVSLAKTKKRPVLLPLLLYGRVAHDGGDPAAILAALRQATKEGCAPPNPAVAIAARRALWDFKRGERAAALEALERLLGDAERQGLTLPRQIFRYQQIQGQRIFNAEQSISVGGHLLNGSGSFQIGLGLQSRKAWEGSFDVRFAPTDSGDAETEAARYYAHLAAVAATFALADKKREQGIRHASRAVGAWVNGVRLGVARVAAGGRTATWVKDGPATIAIAAQLAADAELPMLAGDLWTLAQASLDPAADDAAVTAILDPLPPHLRGIPEIESVKKRALARLQTVAHDLTCTGAKGEIADHERVTCDRYPVSLGLRIADALPYLPRLKKGAEIGRPTCAVWRRVDDFLFAADEGRYEPDKLTLAVTSLAEAGHLHSAATMLARQRLPQHCSPDLARLARGLGVHEQLGVHLRADLYGVAANCSSPTDVAGDLAELDRLTAAHADPTRNFSVLIFAAKLAAADAYAPLYAMTQREGFVRRWQQLNPELATAALLLHHAAAIGAKEKLDLEGTLPFYRLLCTTFPSEERGAFCNAITLLRGSGPAADKRKVAQESVKRFVEQSLQRARGGAP